MCSGAKCTGNVTHFLCPHTDLVRCQGLFQSVDSPFIASVSGRHTQVSGVADIFKYLLKTYYESGIVGDCSLEGG